VDAPHLALSVGFWSDQFVNGLTTGSLYALIALGYTMVYGVLKMINFAHGEVFLLGSFAGYGVIDRDGRQRRFGCDGGGSDSW